MIALQNEAGGTLMRTKAITETTQYWQRHVEAFNSSGLTREAYSKKNRIRVYQLDYWRRKASRTNKTRKSESRNQWVPLQISDEPIDNNSHIEFRIGRIRVEIKRGFDSKLLAEFLRSVGDVC
jgi:hypothetical protein